MRLGGIHTWNLLHLINSAPSHSFDEYSSPKRAELDRREVSHLPRPLTSSRTGFIYWCSAVNIRYKTPYGVGGGMTTYDHMCCLSSGGREEGMEGGREEQTNKRKTVHPELQRPKPFGLAAAPHRSNPSYSLFISLDRLMPAVLKMCCVNHVFPQLLCRPGPRSTSTTIPNAHSCHSQSGRLERRFTFALISAQPIISDEQR